MSAIKVLEQAGLEPTRNRCLVLNAVLDAGEAVTPPVLLKTLTGTMNKVTLYRILDLLVDAGLIEKHSGTGRAYHYCTGHGHGHFHCSVCGRVLCVTLPFPTPAQADFTDTDIARVDSVEIWLDGICADCAGK